MRTLRRNKQTIHYTVYNGVTAVTDSNGLHTGEYEPSYGTVTEAKMYVSPATRKATLEMFGITGSFDKILITDDMSCPITETSIVWIDTPTTNANNYVVVRVAKALNHITYAVTQVDNESGEAPPEPPTPSETPSETPNEDSDG